MKILFLRVLRKLRVLHFVNLYFSVLVNNSSIKVPVIAGVGFYNLDVTEKWMITVLKQLDLSEDELFVDVGVNIGQTLIKLKSIYPNIEYLGFEPNPECVHYTQNLIHLNKWDNATLIPAGIAEHTGIIQLNYFSQDATDSSASIIADFRAENAVTKKAFCSCFSAADIEFLFSGKSISVIKIDVEGAELEVIQGMQSLLQQHRPYMLVEILPVYDGENNTRLNPQVEIEQILTDLAYTKYRIHKDSNGKLSHLEPVEEIGVHDNLDWCDYLFSPVPVTGG